MGVVVLVFPGNEDQQADPGTDRAVGQVESGKAKFLAAAAVEIKAQKIDDLVVAQAVHEIAGDAAKNQTQGELPRAL